jgi:hypothetical protein
MAIPNMSGYVTDDLWAELGAHFDDGQIYELGMCAAALIGMTKFLFTFDLGERTESCPVVRP